jgi:hypothetical protein
MRLRRLSDEDLVELRESLNRYGELRARMQLLSHLAYVSEEALRVSGPLPSDGTYDDPESGVQAFLEERGWNPVIAALRETTAPAQFARYMRKALRNYYISVGRRQREPRLWDRTAKLLKENVGRRYTPLEQNHNRRLCWWGLRGWLRDHVRHGQPGNHLFNAGAKALDGLPRVKDRPQKKYAPKILSNDSLNDLVSGTMEGVDEGLQLDHYGWLFPRLFPVEYRRIDAESYEARVENLGNAGELTVKASVDEAVDRDILDAIPDEMAARRLMALSKHGGDVHAAAADLGEDAELIDGDRRIVERYLRQRGFGLDDLERVIDRLRDD